MVTLCVDAYDREIVQCLQARFRGLGLGMRLQPFNTQTPKPFPLITIGSSGKT